MFILLQQTMRRTRGGEQDFAAKIHKELIDCSLPKEVGNRYFSLCFQWEYELSYEADQVHLYCWWGYRANSRLWLVENSSGNMIWVQVSLSSNQQGVWYPLEDGWVIILLLSPKDFKDDILSWHWNSIFSNVSQSRRVWRKVHFQD